MKIYLFLTLAAVLIMSISCRNTPIIPESPEISFQSDVLPVLAGNCEMSGCHVNTQGGERHARPFNSYDQVMSNGGIVPFDAHQSDLYNMVTNAPGSDLMPPSQYPRLSQQQLLKIYLWIMQGAKDN
jgi:hypothetical protein